MRILLVSPAAKWATYDVYNGYLKAFRQLECEVWNYNFLRRLHYAVNVFCFDHKLKYKDAQKLVSEHWSQIAWLATEGIIANAVKMDWVIFISAMDVHPDVFLLLKEMHKRTAVIFTESPYNDERQLRLVPYIDLCFTNEKSSLGFYKEKNPNSFYLPHACDPDIHKYIKSRKYWDVSFVATWWPEREQMLSSINWDGIRFYLGGFVTEDSKLRKNFRGGIMDNAHSLVNLYNRSKICLNHHRTLKYWDDVNKKQPLGQYEHIKSAYSLNPRTYELASCRAFQLCDSTRQELFDVFGDTIAVYSSDDLEDKIRYYLCNKKERESFSLEAQKIAHQNTFKHRAEYIISFMNQI